MARQKIDYTSEEFLELAELQLQYFRTHLDVFIETAFAPIKLTRDQKIQARAAGNCSSIYEVCSRGWGKTWLAALIAFSIADLYPGSKVVCVSSTAPQATLILQKLRLLADQNQNILNEIKTNNAKNAVSISKDRAKCILKNGSTIESYPLEAVRGLRAQVTIADEVLDIDQEMLEAILAPTRNARRDISMTYGFPDMRNKALFLTSCCPKSNPFYESFMSAVRQIDKGNDNVFACAFDYRAAISNGITDAEFFEEERARMPESTFQLEYGTIFLGSDGDSALPYALVDTCRTLKQVELEQPKNSKSRYVISMDIATSAATNSDNTVISVIKFNERADGSYHKKLVYMRSYNGKKLDYLADELRKLYFTKFPSAEKIIVDLRGLGDSLPRFLDSTYTDFTTGKEYPPLVVDDEPNHNPKALQVIHPVRAVNAINQRIYTNLRVCLEQQSIELPISARIMQIAEADKDEDEKKLSMEERDIYIQTDALQYEMSNIKGKVSQSGNVIYDCAPRLHKDRYSSMAYGLDYICELEKENIRKNSRPSNVVVGIVDSL